MRPRGSLIPLLLALGCASPLPKDPPPLRPASAVVASPDGKRTARAQVRFHKGGVSYTSGRPDELLHLLTVTSGATTTDVEVGRYTAGYLGQTPAAEYRAAVKADFMVTWARDGHAVSASADGGKTWRHVVLDAGAPFPCGVGSTVSPAPPTRELVLENLRATGFGKLRTCEISGATRALCARSGDAELWALAADQLLGTELVDTERYPLLTCLRAEAKVSPSILRRLLDSTRGRQERLELAAEALAGSADPEAQVALARALRGLLDQPKEDATCWTRAKVSWSLASITVQRRAAEPSTRALLVEVARAPDGCPTALAGKAVRVYALKALVALEDPIVGELAARCTGPDAAWEVPFEQWNDAMLLNLTDRPLECLAKAARGR